MKPSISIVLPNYNGRNLLERNIPSILEALVGIDNEIIVVDDCSSDDSVEFLEKSYPAIKIIRSNINCGFSTTCNKGIFAAKHQLLCIANTDVTFTPDYFKKTIVEFSDQSIFAVKGDIINYKKSFDDVINIDRTISMYYKRGFLRFDSRTPLTERAVFEYNDENFTYLGCCFVCTKKAMFSLNGFDPIYSPFYWEDADLAQRGMKLGLKILYLPEARVYHQASSTISKYRSNFKRKLISNRNKFIFTWRHLDTRRLWLSHTPITALNLLSRWLILNWTYYAAFYMAATQIIRDKRRTSCKHQTTELL